MHRRRSTCGYCDLHYELKSGHHSHEVYEGRGRVGASLETCNTYLVILVTNHGIVKLLNWEENVP